MAPFGAYRYPGDSLLDRIDPASVREWHSTLTASLKSTLRRTFGRYDPPLTPLRGG